MLKRMGKSPRSLAGRTVGRFLRFGMLRGLRSVEVDPENFRRSLAEKHGLWVPHFGRMRDVPIEKLDAIAERMIHDAQRLAMAQGAGFGLGGVITLIPDASFLTIITLRLIQRLCLLYGFAENEQERRVQMWLAAAAATGIDFGKDLAEKQMIEKLAPRLASRLAIRIGEESAEKWIGRIVPLASSAIGGALNYSFVKTWGWRVQRHLREKHLAERGEAMAREKTLRPAARR
jgi:EcsC protein family